MKTSKLLLTAVAFFAFVATANTSFAQTKTVQATGTVLQPISFTNATNLTFGTALFPGISKTVGISDAGAATFDIAGEADKGVTVTFTLPTELTLTTGSATMPITFASTDAGYSTTDDPSGATTFDPGAGAATTTLGTTSGLLYVWLGGTVDPAINQTAGDYAADITLDVAYTGN